MTRTGFMLADNVKILSNTLAYYAYLYTNLSRSATAACSKIYRLLRLDFQLLAFRKFLRRNRKTRHFYFNGLLVLTAQELLAAPLARELYLGCTVPCHMFIYLIIILFIHALFPRSSILFFMYLYGRGFHSRIFPNKTPLSLSCLLEFRLESDVKRSQSLLIPVDTYLL